MIMTMDFNGKPIEVIHPVPYMDGEANLVDKKMYVIARAQLEPIYQCVQGAHALVDYTERFPALTAEWGNEYLIFVNTYALDQVIADLDYKGIPFGKFLEPDMGYCTTAIACYTDSKYFIDLKLIRA